MGLGAGARARGSAVREARGEFGEKPVLLHVRSGRRQECGGKRDPGGPGRPAGWRARATSRTWSAGRAPEATDGRRVGQWPCQTRDGAGSTHTGNSIWAEVFENLSPRHLLSDWTRGTGAGRAVSDASGFLAGNLGNGGVGPEMETRGQKKVWDKGDKLALGHG